MKNKTTSLTTLKDIVNQFVLCRISTAIEKKLSRNKKYKELEEKIDELENQISSFLTNDEQKEVFINYSDLIVELSCIREEFVYRRGMIDAFRIKDVISGAFE